MLERDPRLVIEDMRKRIVSPWAARNVYRIAFNEETLELDYEETKKLREQERKRRKREGRPYHEFMKEWSQKQPREDIIRSYGPWPEGIK